MATSSGGIARHERGRRPLLSVSAPNPNAITIEALPAGGFILSKRSERTNEMQLTRAVTDIEELFDAMREAFA